MRAKIGKFPSGALKYLILAVIVVLVSGAGLWNLHKSRTFQIFGNIVSRVDTPRKVVALTFDDGPAGHTDLLPVLKEFDVKATFFVVGQEMKRNMQEARRLVEEGHELGNHSFSHQRMVFKSQSWISREIEDTDRLIREAGFNGEIHFRPPYGKKLVFLPFHLARTGRTTITWDMEPESFPEIGGDSGKIVEYIAEKVRPGSIILLHGLRKTSAESVRPIIEMLTAQGYRLVTVSELLALGKN